MATDIMDKDLKQLRNERWEKAFAEQKPERRSSFGPGLNREQIHRKATIVIEHLIQASDVAHTMQHWHIYRKWNERLFFEMSLAHFSGRSPQDPAENWYKGELGFFDFYIIPLAKKLKDCGVFGVSRYVNILFVADVSTCSHLSFSSLFLLYYLAPVTNTSTMHRRIDENGKSADRRWLPRC